MKLLILLCVCVVLVMVWAFLSFGIALMEYDDKRDQDENY